MTSPHVWFFDLDGTLYDPRAGLWPAVGARIEAFLQRFLGLDAPAARALRRRYVQQYGTTLRGLMEEHPQVDPHAYLDFVAQVPVEAFVRPDPRLRALLAQLPGPKWVFTNGDAPYARRVLRALKVDDAFDGIIDIVQLNFVGKPWPEAYEHALQLARAPRQQALLVDDVRANVDAARAAGWQAVWVHPEAPAPRAGEIPHIYALLQGLPKQERQR
ncbi:MAG: pyrimidine 5'-nucleotidase [Chloroflexi bacterium]|nr:pyrimidine 5'-nucleotidase [Chloroflexota bacterium]